MWIKNGNFVMVNEQNRKKQLAERYNEQKSVNDYLRGNKNKRSSNSVNLMDSSNKSML